MNWRAGRWPRLGGTAGVALVLVAVAFVLPLSGWTWRADRLVYDIGLSTWRRPVPEGITVVAIDDASVAAIGRWPWPRAVHATLLSRLAEAKPTAIGLDVTFSEPDPDPAQDTLLARQLAKAAPVVLSVDWMSAGPGQPPTLLAPVTGLPPGVRLGTAEASVDADGVMRHAFLSAGSRQSPVPHMAVALLQAAGESLAPGLPVTADDDLDLAAGPWQRGARFLVRYAGPPGHLDRVSYVDVLRGAVPPERLAGRYVLVGMTATGLGDTVATPVNRQRHAMPGVEVLGHALYTLRSGDTVRALSPLASAVLSAALVLVLMAGIQRLGARWALALAVGAWPVVIGASLLALGGGLWWSPVSWALAAALAYPLWSWRRLEQAVDALDAEIGRLVPEGGLDVGIAAWPASQRRDVLALRLDTLHTATDTLRSARRFLSDALAGLPTAMAVTDPQGRVLLANALAAQLFELDKAEDMLGMELPGLLVEFVPAKGAGGAVDLEAIFQPGSAPPVGWTVEARVERLGDFLLHFAPVLLLEQQRWVVTFSDVSAIKQAQRRRDRALAFVSHDLRSPAQTILLLADLYQRGRMEMPLEAFLVEIQRLGARTLQLADDFVRVSHVESRPLQVSSVAVAALLDEVAADFRPQAVAADVALVWRHDPTSPATPADHWSMDRALVQRAVGNLVSNALKHSPAGGQVTVLAGCSARQDALHLTVCDQGPGLSPAQRERLNHGDDGLPAEDMGGVGLGLQFVQRVAQRHRGRLLALGGGEGADRQDGAGGRFTLTLGRLGMLKQDNC
jgi:CHASE2 domain-containing sensor protein/signal transduction histidine kinase